MISKGRLEQEAFDVHAFPYTPTNAENLSERQVLSNL